MEDKVLFKIFSVLFVAFLLLIYVPIIFANQVAGLIGYGLSGVLLDGGFGDLFKLVLPIYVVLFLSLGLGYKFSRRAGNIVSLIWGLVLLVSMVVLVWQN